MVSNCKTISKREYYVDELKKYIDVDIVGRCGEEMNCTRQDRSICDENLIKEYYFYLSFENSFCEDYITEKTWNRLKLGIIPIVLGSGDYEKDLPPRSYIDVKDFSSPKKLAEYLKIVKSSEKLYSSYHAWRSKQKVIFINSLCEICKYAYESIGKTQIIPDINLLWNGTRSCVMPEQYYKGIFDLDNVL